MRLVGDSREWVGLSGIDRPQGLGGSGQRAVSLGGRRRWWGWGSFPGRERGGAGGGAGGPGGVSSRVGLAGGSPGGSAPLSPDPRCPCPPPPAGGHGRALTHRPPPRAPARPRPGPLPPALCPPRRRHGPAPAAPVVAPGPPAARGQTGVAEALERGEGPVVREGRAGAADHGGRLRRLRPHDHRHQHRLLAVHARLHLQHHQPHGRRRRAAAPRGLLREEGPRRPHALGALAHLLPGR